MRKRKKILFIRPTLGDGGADRVTLTLLREIDREIYQPELALLRNEGVFASEIPNDIVVHNCNASSLWTILIPLMTVIKKGRFDILYSTSGGTNIPTIICKLLSASSATCLIISERNILFPPNKGYLKRKLMLLLKTIFYHKVDWVTVVSKGVGEEVSKRLKISKEKIIVVNNPVIDSVLLSSQTEEVNHPFFQGSIPVLLAVGRMVPQKDYPLLLKAFQLVLKKKKARLFILGKGPDLDKYRSLATNLGLSSDEIYFAGFDKNPFKYMAKCDSFVLSSKHEGMPGVLVQAMACGAACVSTDCPTGPNEIIEHGVNGLLCPVGDAEALARNILIILGNPELKQQFNNNAPAAVERFRLEPALESYLNFL